MSEIAIWVRDYIVYLPVFVVLLILVGWRIWVRSNKRQAYQVRTRARSWLGQRWDGFMRWLNS